MAIKTPIILLSPTARPLVIQPSATIEQVFKCPTTVLDTGPVCAMMKNCDILIRHAKNPLCSDRLLAYAILSAFDTEGQQDSPGIATPIQGEGNDSLLTIIIIIQRFKGTSAHTGNVSMKGMT